MKYVRILLITLASWLLLTVAFWFVAGRLISGAFKSSSRDSGLNRLSDVLEGGLGATLASGNFHVQGSAPSNLGLLEYYKRNPEQLQRDKAYFETWRSAATIATSALDHQHYLNEWTRSTDITWIPESNKKDFWGHAFCIRSSQLDAVIVSPGPNAVSSLDCASVNLPQKEIDQMSRGRLNFHPSGVLVLPVQQPRTAPTALRIGSPDHGLQRG